MKSRFNYKKNLEKILFIINVRKIKNNTKIKMLKNFIF